MARRGRPTTFGVCKKTNKIVKKATPKKKKESVVLPELNDLEELVLEQPKKLQITLPLTD